jgi:hypothetical protein
VIPRDGSQPRGKARPLRQKSFATHVDMKDMLERATPMFGVEAIDDTGEEQATNIEAPPPPTTTPKPALAPVPPPDGPDSTMRIRTGPPGDSAAPPSQASLVLLGLGGLVLAVVAVFVFFKMRDRGGLAPDAAPKLDAPFYMLPDATTADAAPPETVDAAPVEPEDAAPAPRDAQPTAPHDAPVKSLADAAADPKPDAKVAPTGTGTIEIGADPWGDVIVDGTKRGRVPPGMTLSLPAGKHTVEVIYGGEIRRARRRSRSI